jgi:hypothetical protein
MRLICIRRKSQCTITTMEKEEEEEDSNEHEYLYVRGQHFKEAL